jgi:hypothetical protein
VRNEPIRDSSLSPIVGVCARSSVELQSGVPEQVVDREELGKSTGIGVAFLRLEDGVAEPGMLAAHELLYERFVIEVDDRKLRIPERSTVAETAPQTMPQNQYGRNSASDIWATSDGPAPAVSMNR